MSLSNCKAPYSVKNSDASADNSGDANRGKESSWNGFDCGVIIIIIISDRLHGGSVQLRRFC